MYIIAFEGQAKLNQQIANLLVDVDELGGGSWGNLPSILNIFSITQAARAWNLINITCSNKDLEGVGLSILCFAQRIFGCFGAVPSALRYCNRVWTYLTPTILHYIVLTSCIFALVYCVIEATSEVLGLYRQIKFYYSPLMRLSRAIEKIEQTSEEDRCQRLQHVVNKIFALASSDLTAEARTQALSCLHIVAKSKQSGKAIGSQDFFELCAGIRLISSQLFRQKYLNPQNVNAIVELARRVGTKPLQELELKLRLNEVRHRSNQKQSLEVEKNDRIFTHLNQQAWKKIFIHQIGLLAVVFTTIAIALTLFGGGAVSFYAIGLTFSIVRHLITYGVTNEGHGWHFRLLPCLPQLMTRKIAAPPCIEIELTELKKYTAVGMKL